MGRKKRKFYAVRRGHRPGIDQEWEGKNGARAQVSGYPQALFRGFHSRQEAEQWLGATDQSEAHEPGVIPRTDQVKIYTDGGARKNPGPGGYAAVLLFDDQRVELSGGYHRTTNNRMEMLACIKGLMYFKIPRVVNLYSDSRYVVNGMNKKWALRWRRNHWMRNKDEPAENADLWAKLLELADFHQVTFQWIRGHAGHPENERCDTLVGEAMNRDDLPEDRNFLDEKTREPVYRF
jgi:ribonuclease HI